MMTPSFSQVLDRIGKSAKTRLAGLLDRPSREAQLFEPLEGRQMLSVVVDHEFTPGMVLTQTATNGNVVTFALTGKGVGILHTVDGVFSSVSLSGTTAASSLTVTVKGGAELGTVGIGSITVAAGAINAINATKVNLLGDLTVDATSNTITLNDVTGSDITLNKGNTVAGPNIKLGTVTDSSITIDGALASVDVASWDDTDGTDDAINAKSIGKVSSRGKFNVSLTLSGNAVATQPTLGSASIAGEIYGAKWQAAGFIGAISAGFIFNVDINATKVASITATKSGSVELVVTAGQLGSFVSRGGADVVKLRINQDGTPSPVNFQAIGSISVTGDATNLSITSTDTNSNIGAVTVTGSNTNFHASVAGNFASYTGKSVGDFNVNAGAMGSFVLQGDGESVSITASKVSNVSIGGSLTNADFVFESKATAVFQANSSFKVTGTTVGLDITSENAFGNFGTINLVNSLTAGNWIIAGNVSSITTIGTLGDLNFEGKTVASITVGSLNNVDMDLLSLGRFAASFVVSDFKLTLNTGWATQAKSFRALGSFTSTGKADHLTITASGANSNFGAFTFTQGVTDSAITLNGDGTTFSSPGISSVHVTAGKLQTITLKGDVTTSSFKATSMAQVSVTGAVSGLSLTVNEAGSTNKGNMALTGLTITGSAASLNVTGTGIYSNMGPISIAGDVTKSNFNINGNVTKLTAKSYDAESTGHISGNLGVFSTTGILSVFGGNYTVGGKITTLTSASTFSATVSAKDNIGPVNIGTTMNGGVIRTTGSIGTVNIGFMTDSMILSGYAFEAALPTGLPDNNTAFTNPLATMGTVTIKIIGFPPAPSFIRSVIAGVKLGLVSLKRVDTAGAEDSDTNFGISASKSVQSVVGVGLPPLNNLMGTGIKYQDGHFVVKIVGPG